MITINFEGWVRGPTALHRVWFVATGNTPEEVMADAKRQAEACHVEEGFTAVGLHNREADWAMMYGGDSYDASHYFADTPRPREPEPPKRPWWKLFWRRA